MQRPLNIYISLNRPGDNLGQAPNSFLTIIRDENVKNFSSFSVNSLASFCKWSWCGGGNDSANQHSLQTPHLSCHSRWCAFVSPSPWSFCGSLSWRAHLLITHSCMFISGPSLAFFLPPAGSLALLLSSSDRRWSSVSLTLLGSREKCLAAASPKFSSEYIMTESLNFKSYFLLFCCTGAMAIISVILTDRKQHNTWKRRRRKNVQCQWSRLLPWLKKIIIIYLELAVIYQNIHPRLIKTRLLFCKLRWTLPDGSVNRTKVICTYCQHEMSYHRSTLSLKYHLQAKHTADAESPPPPKADPKKGLFFPAWFEVLNKNVHNASIFALSYVVKGIKNMKKYIKVHLEQKKNCN